MKITKKLFMLVLVICLVVAPLASVTSVSAAGEIKENQEFVPALEVYEDEDGTFSVKAFDEDGNIIYDKSGLTGTDEEVMANVYDDVLIARALRSCSHIPCNADKVWGGINHIVGKTTCQKVQSQFWKCRCCKGIIKMVPNSTKVVGTHSAKDHK